jgi:hypothetical protein
MFAIEQLSSELSDRALAGPRVAEEDVQLGSETIDDELRPGALPGEAELRDVHPWRPCVGCEPSWLASYRTKRVSPRTFLSSGKRGP